MTPADGDAFFTSAMTFTNPFGSCVTAEKKFRTGMQSRYMAWSSVSGVTWRAAAISCFLVFTIFSNIFSLSSFLPESLLVSLSNILFPAAVLAVSVSILLKLKVFSPHKLDNAPQRPNRLTAIELIATLFVALAIPILLRSVIKRVDILSSLMDVMAALFIILAVSQRFADGRRGLGIGGPGKLKAVGFGVLLYVGVMPWLIIVEALSAIGQKLFLHEKNQLHPVLKQLEKTHSPEQILSLVVMICIIAPIAEELFFRGLLQTLIIRTIAVVRRRDTDAEHVRGGERLAGILIAAAIFAAVHLSVTADAWSWLPALFLLGVTLGYAYERTGKLWADITIHSLFNAFAVVMIVGFHAGAPATAHTPVAKPLRGITPSSVSPAGPPQQGLRPASPDLVKLRPNGVVLHAH